MRRFRTGERVLIACAFGSPHPQPWETVRIVDQIYGSPYQYLIEHTDGRRGCACDGWLRPADFLIIEDVDLWDLVSL